jgi:hypothetical protein
MLFAFWRASLALALNHKYARFWPFATGDILTATGRFRGIADMAGPAGCPAQSRLTRGNHRSAPSKRACTGPGSAQLFLISRPPALILIAAPFSSRLSRYRRSTEKQTKPCRGLFDVWFADASPLTTFTRPVARVTWAV